jgi:hypothetical protein
MVSRWIVGFLTVSLFLAGMWGCTKTADTGSRGTSTAPPVKPVDGTGKDAKGPVAGSQ